MQAYDRDVSDSLVEYQRAVRDRANETHNELHHALSAPYPGQTSPPRSGAGPAHMDISPEALAKQEQVYQTAVDRLRNILQKPHGSSSRSRTGARPPTSPGRGRSPSRQPLFPSSPEKFGDPHFVPASPIRHLGDRGHDLPPAEELVPLLTTQDGYIQQLEAENRYVKEELSLLKGRVKEVVEENQKLHESQKGRHVAATLDEELGIPQTQENVPAASTGVDSSLPAAENQARAADMKDKDLFQKWQRELERLKALYTAKTGQLEALLKTTKSELGRKEEECNALQAKVRQQESLGLLGTGVGEARQVGGVCIRCAQQEAVLSGTQVGTLEQNLQRVTRERDELMDALSQTRSLMSEMKQREDEAYEQVKQSVALVEQAHLEKTEALVQRAQVTEELANQRKRLEDIINDTNRRVKGEREAVQREYQQQVEQLKNKMSSLEKSQLSLQAELEQAARDKASLRSELDETKGHLSTQGADVDMMSDGVQSDLSRAVRAKHEAEEEMTRLKQKLERERKETDQEHSRLSDEVAELRRRLRQAEKEAMDSREEGVHLTEAMNALQREANLARMEKESIERGRSDDLKEAIEHAQRREKQLIAEMEQKERQQAQSSVDLDTLVTTQKDLISRLRDECRDLTTKLEELGERYRSDVGRLSQLNEDLSLRLAKASEREKGLEQQCVEHGRLHQRMKTRLKQMDQHAQNSAQQVLELLTKQNGLMQDRQSLCQEVEFLRSQMTNPDSFMGTGRPRPALDIDNGPVDL
ncbi:serologically defined colon cancer antigen 8 homolog isoform X2 [Branchiostoma floridae]|uniref:Serologically defined colon cancer antigen 8 homolog isoform X2 n=1 Tax=Branchiostoma floridae TaxID=7739 RepID=A0A9J7MHQ5_BRAFL|nr:serologically defined colon cancer antigen 8 homolog isoform X2 [Branchiostoma floridae]